jgi:hypothetical protein
MEENKYRLLYLKYKQKYINLKGGRLIDILDDLQNNDIKKHCATTEDIKTNFTVCNNFNDKLATSNNSYIIFLWFIDYFDPDSIKPLENIILFHKAKSTNVFIFSNRTDRVNNSINFTPVTNKDFQQKFKQTIESIINKHKTELESTINITIYNMAHGDLTNFNSISFLSSDFQQGPKVSINKDEYFDCIRPIFDSKNVINLSIVNNNCFSSTIYHGYFKDKMEKENLAKNNVNLFTYSTMPYIKYLFYLRFILLFFSKEFIETYISLESDNDKFNHFSTINTLICNKLDREPRFANSVITIFYESIKDIKNSLNKLFNFFQLSDNSEYLNDIFDKLNKSSFKDNYAYNSINFNINSIDLFDDKNITNSIIGYLEQGSSTTSESYLKFQINATIFDFNYNRTLDVNKTIKYLNTQIRVDGNFVDEFMAKNWAIIGGLGKLNDFLDNNLLKKIITMSFVEQNDILFVPIEPNDDKRERMRKIKLIDLL